MTKAGITRIQSLARTARASVKPLADSDSIERAKNLLKQKDALLVAHYYVPDELQQLAEESGGIVADSLEMARFGMRAPHSTIIVAGVRFMGETAKVLSPEKDVYVLDQKAECSLDLSCPIDRFSDFCDAHPSRTIVVYANTSAAVKARSDWVVTSSIALDVVAHLKKLGEKILWAPDRFLGDYICHRTGADMLLWDGSCIVHEEFKSTLIPDAKKRHPDALVLAHPESPLGVLEQADVVGSTTALIKAVSESDRSTFIVATEKGIFHKMRSLNPNKHLIEAPTAGDGATCESCAVCPWMKMNAVSDLIRLLEKPSCAIEIESKLIEGAQRSIGRMISFRPN